MTKFNIVFRVKELENMQWCIVMASDFHGNLSLIWSYCTQECHVSLQELSSQWKRTKEVVRGYATSWGTKPIILSNIRAYIMFQQVSEVESLTHQNFNPDFAGSDKIYCMNRYLPLNGYNCSSIVIVSPGKQHCWELPVSPPGSNHTAASLSRCKR